MSNNNFEIHKSGLAVDIDETLSWTIGHWVAGLQENFGNPEKLTVKELIEKYRYTQNVPYWQSSEALEWVDKKIHSNEEQKILPLIEGADFYLNKINQLIPIAAYITARPEVVQSGTKHWIKKHKLPEAPILCRPTDVTLEDSHLWKAKILKKNYPKIVGIIDDNAKLVKNLEPDYKGKVFLYEHTSTDSRLDVVPCMNWLHVYEEIKKIK